jgi:hypothetical protein
MRCCGQGAHEREEGIAAVAPTDRMTGRGLLLSLLAVGALGLVACEGDDAETTAANSPRQATPSAEQQIERDGNKWARLFAAGGGAACRYMTQPGCARIKCERGPNRPNLKTCTRPSARYRKSFADATVQDIAIRGHRAGARFSNGEGVDLSWVNGYAVGGVWWVGDVGGNAGCKFFASSTSCRNFRRAGLDGRALP